MNKKRLVAAIGAVVLITLTIAVPLTTRSICANETDTVPRPGSWAQPIEMEGVPNLYKLSDDVYRSAQPSAEGMTNIEEMGIRTIVNLRSFNSDRDEIEGTALGCEQICMKAWHSEEEDAVEFLQIVSDPNRVPVVVHCNLGSDRTGTMCAVYRVAVQGWSKEEAIAEMTQGGFGFNKVWTNLPMWVSALETNEIRMQAGINQGPQEGVPPLELRNGCLEDLRMRRSGFEVGTEEIGCSVRLGCVGASMVSPWPVLHSIDCGFNPPGVYRIQRAYAAFPLLRLGVSATQLREGGSRERYKPTALKYTEVERRSSRRALAKMADALPSLQPQMVTGGVLLYPGRG